MNRREALKSGATILVGGVASQLVGCGSSSSPTAPTPPSSNPSVTIDTYRVGELKHSVTSPVSGNLYFDAFPKLSLAIGTHRYEKDRVTGTPLNGFAVIAVNGDYGPEMVNVLGERTNVGWVVGIGNQHGFYNSIQDVNVKAGDRIDFYYGLPCSNPHVC